MSGANRRKTRWRFCSAGFVVPCGRPRRLTRPGASSCGEGVPSLLTRLFSVMLFSSRIEMDLFLITFYCTYKLLKMQGEFEMCQGQLTFGLSHFLMMCSQVRGAQLLPYAGV